MQRIKWIIIGLLCFIPVYWMVIPFLDTLIFSIFLYYSIRPLYLKIFKIISNKTLSIIMSLVIILIPLILFVMYLSSVASTELLSVAKSLGPEYRKTLSEILDQYVIGLKELTWDDLLVLIQENTNIQTLADLGFGILGNIFNWLIRIILIFTFTYIFLSEGHRYRAWMNKNIIYKDAKLMKEFMKSVDTDLESVFYGNLLTAIIVMANGMIVYTFINIFLAPELPIPYPILLGVLCGIASLIPGVGVSLIWIPTAFLLAVSAYLGPGLIENLQFLGIFVVSSLILVDFIPSWLIRAKISGKGVDDSLMFLAYILGPMAFGISGILIGPIVLVLSVNFIKVVLPKLKMI